MLNSLTRFDQVMLHVGHELNVWTTGDPKVRACVEVACLTCPGQPVLISYEVGEAFGMSVVCSNGECAEIATHECPLCEEPFCDDHFDGHTECPDDPLLTVVLEPVETTASALSDALFDIAADPSTQAAQAHNLGEQP